jgi:hypothetical protein
VTVSPEGKATSFTFVKYPDRNTANAVALALKSETYKPAICGGQACTMQLPFRATLR